MNIARRFTLLALAVLSVSAFGQDDISTAISGLRRVPDAQRGAATRDLALKIRALPASNNKSNLALSLAFLSTEGDFGHEALQAVADTLAQTLKETPTRPSDGKPTMAHMELAELHRYEGVSVKLSDPLYKQAEADLDAIDGDRSKADFTLTDLDRKTWSLSALRGKVVLVNFWATWCPPCRKEMPDLDALYWQFKGKGFVVVAITNEDASKVKPFIAQHGYRYPVVLDPGGKVNTLFHVDGIPKSFVYDRKGRLVAQAMDMRTRGQFVRLLARAGLK
jgi:peroxiredoxin